MIKLAIGIAIGVFAVLAYQDPAIVEPTVAKAQEIIHSLIEFVVDKTA